MLSYDQLFRADGVGTVVEIAAVRCDGDGGRNCANGGGLGDDGCIW